MLVMGAASVFHQIMGDTGLRVELVPRAGHFLAEEKPDELLRLAEAYFA